MADSRAPWPWAGRRGIALLAILGAAACQPALPQRRDPLAGLAPEGAAGAYKGLSVALVYSKSTQDVLAAARKGARSGGDAMALANADFEGSVQALADRIARKHFKLASQVSAIEEARSSADLSLVLDVYPTQLKKSGGRPAGWTISAKVVLLEHDGRVLDTLSAESSKEYGFFPGFGPNSSFMKAFRGAFEEAGEALERGVVSSAKLAQFAAAKAAGPVAAGIPGRPAASRARSSSVDTPGYSLPEDPRKFAVIVGVESYTSLPPADFAERDAEAVRSHLAALGYPQRNMMLLSGHRATRSAIEKYVESWLPRQVREDSQVLFYFSGHGAPDPSTGQAYLIPWDGDPKYLESTGYPLKRLYQKLGELKAPRVVVALDSCFSGAGGRSVLAKGLRPLVPKVDESAQALGRIAVVTAAGPDEVTGILDAQGHGTFTYHLLKALEDAKGKTTIRALFEALAPRVQDSAARESREQTPRLFPESASAQAEHPL